MSDLAFGQSQGPDLEPKRDWIGISSNGRVVYPDSKSFGEAQAPILDLDMDWTVVSTRPFNLPGGGNVVFSDCKDYLALQVPGEDPVVSLYRSFSAFYGWVMVEVALQRHQPIPEIDDSLAFRSRIAALVDKVCEQNPAYPFREAMDRVWHLLPKPRQTEGLQLDEFMNVLLEVRRQAAADYKR